MRANSFSSLACVLVLLACATGEDLGGETSNVVVLDGGSKDASHSGAGGRTGGGGKGNTAGNTTSSSGGTNGGGTGAGGKASGAGGGKSSGGAKSIDDAGTADSGQCQAGWKFCDLVGDCSPPAPRIGCGLTGCDPCTLQDPQNGYVTCINNLCDFECNSGFKKNGGSCQAVAAGGAPGAGGAPSGAGGSATQCKASSCKSCGPIFGPGCCTSANKCGCPVVPYVPAVCQ